MTHASLGYVSATYPLNYEQSLPPIAKPTPLTEVTPAKKITFYRSGHPWQSGVKMAVNKRAFKTFDALLDDLSQKVSLPFGVRTITTPRGVHSISTLEQLEDGGSYLCSDKKSIKYANTNAAVRKPASQQGPPPASALQRSTLTARQDEGPSHHIHKGPKKITMIKNGDADVRHSIIMNKRNVQNFRNFLDDISELMQYNVRKLYTLEGKKINNLQALFHCPSVLVCVGHEAFKPITYENFRKNPSEKLPDLSMRSRVSIASESFDRKKNANFGLEAKKSVIHPRSPSRSPRISLSSDKSYPNGLNMSSGNSGYASFMDSCPHKKNGETLTDDDIQKRVHVNKDGSLTVEMKVRFHLLNEETLQWSTQIRRFSLPRKNSFNSSCSSEDQGMENVEQINPNNDSEIDEPFCSSETDDSYISKLNEAEHAENHCQNCCNHCQEYDIWKNPIDVEKPQGEETRNVSQARSSCSTTSSCRRITQKKESDGSVRTTSSEEYTQHIVQQAVCYSKSGENGDGSRMRYGSLRRCRSQNSSSVSVSDMGRNHESRESTASRHRASPQPSTGCSHQDNEVFQEPTNKQTFVSVSPSPSIANSKKNSAVKTTDTSIPSPTGPSTSSRKPESTAEEDRPVGKISKSSAGSKQTKGEESSEERAHSAASSCSSHVAKDSNQSVGCNHLPSKPTSAASSCPSQTSRKASAMDNVLDTEDVCSVGFSCSHNSGNNLQEAISEDGRPKSEMSLSSGRSKTGKQVKEDFSESEKQSSQGSSCCEMVGSHPELHVQDSNSNDRPISSNSRSSKHSKKNKRCKVKKDLDIDDTSVATSFSSVFLVAQNPALSLAPEEDGRPCSNASCSEASNGKNKVKLTFQQPPCSTYSEPPSLSENKELNVANSDNESPRPSSSESESCPNSKRNKNRMTKSEAESRPSTSASCNSKADPNVCADQQANNQDQRPVSSASGLSELVQEENSIKIESTGSEKASNICSSVSKASKSKIESTQVKDASEETNLATVELSLATGDEDAAAVIDSALGQRMRQPSPPKGKPGGKNVRQLIKSSSQKSGSSTGTCSVVAEEVTDEKPPESKLDVSRSKSNLSEKSSGVNSYKTDERINHKSVTEKTSERGSRKTTCKHGYQIKKDPDENHTNVDACEKDDFIPSELPNASLEEVVQKWLQKIPLENLLGTCDSLEEFTAGHEKPETNVMAEGTKPEVEEATIIADKSEEEATASERESTEKNDLEAAKLEDDGSSNADNNDTMRDVVETSQAKPVNSDLRVTAKPDNPQNRDLPNNAHSSIQIMKVLLCPKQGTKLDRSNSLPELSSEPEKKLSLSAKSLLTCLRNLQPFDEESLHSKDKSPNSNNSRYEELLGILQSLWLTGIADGDENKAPPMAGNHSKPFKVHNSVDHDITPMSSSGVDVNSGSGSSGESNINGTVNTSLSTEKINCDSALKTCSVTDENSTEIKQPHLVKSSLEEKSDVCCKLNEKDEQYSTSSTLMSNGCCRTQTLKSCENSQNQSQENIIGNRSETLQSDAVSSSNVTPDIAYRVQWSSGGKIINNAGPGENSKSDTAEKPQDTMQNIKGQDDPSTDRMEIIDRESCPIQEIIHQSETTNHNRPEDVNDPEEEKNMDNKITEQCDNVDGKESPEQIGTDKECTVQNPAEEKESVSSQKISPDPDPAWVMKLLKKIEKEFIAHYVDAMNDFKIKWNLDNSDTLDQMIADLREEVRSRIQTSIKKELKKVQGRAGKKVARPPQDQIRHASSEQTDQRRRRLRSMFKQSNCDDNKMNKTPADDKATSKKNNYEQSTGNTSSLISDRNLNFTPTIGDDTEVNEELSIDEFCPCESCTEKSKASKPETNPVQSFAPVNKAFDLQEILKMNKASKNVEKNGSDASEMLDGVSNKQNSAERDSFGCVKNKDNTELKIENGDNTEVKTEDKKQTEDKMGDEENVEVKPKDGENEEDKTGDGENLEVKTEEKENVELKTEDGENAKDKTEDGEKVEETTEDEENTEAETEGVVQDDESLTENQKNLHNEDSSHGSDETSHQDEAEEAKGDLDQDSSLQDIDKEQNLVEQCADEIESLSGKSEGSVNIKADDAKELTEETHNSICKHELQPQEDDDHSEGISECSECEADNMKHATEEHTTTPEANGEQKKQSEDSNPLLEDDSDTMDMDNSQDNAKEIIGSNVREIDAFENLDEVSELSDEYVESNFVKNQDEEEVEDVGVDGRITTKHSPSPDSSSQVQAAEVQRDSAMEASNGDCIQVKSGEDVNSISDKTVPRATQMYPESSSDDESETKCNSPEEPANQKDGNDTESDKVSSVNKSKQAVNGGFDEEDLDF